MFAKKEEKINKNCASEELLPIGSIVQLEGINKKIMICGVKQNLTENESDEIKEYDYVGVVYPEGFVGVDYFINFDHSDIKTTVFTGYSDNERLTLLKKIKNYLEKKQNI